MARARNIKPGFYINEALAGCSIFARYIFPGLWMHADREGRLEDRPLRLKAALLPYDNGDMDALLEELHKAGLILRYSIGDARYIQVINFEKHQNPHQREGESLIPAPGNYSELEPIAQDKHSAGTGQAQCQHPTSPAESPIPITESREKQYAPDKPARFDPRAYLLTLGVDAEVITDWLALRKQKRAAVTPTAIAGVQREAGKAGVSLESALRTCCERGWQGFRADWLKGNPSTASPSGRQGRRDDYLRQQGYGQGAEHGTGSGETVIDGTAQRID